jgi:methylenetetrahydrofolate dehydrogenase (NADP+)/methenyltetrahydrofolate cyclohydrolase
VTALVVDGRAEAERRLADLAGVVRRLGLEPPPTLAIVVAATPEARRNLGVKRRMAAEAGVVVRVDELPEPVTQEAAEAAVVAAGADEGVDGVFVQFPLPGGLDEAAVLRRIPPGKDVDGPPLGPAAVHATLVALAAAGVHWPGRRILLLASAGGPARSGPSPTFLDELAASFAGSPVERSDVGRGDWADACRRAEIVVTAAGVPRLVTSDHLGSGAVVVDAGVSRVDGAVVGDVDVASAVARAGVIVPSPGGLGPLTVEILLHATVIAADARRGPSRRYQPLAT